MNAKIITVLNELSINGKYIGYHITAVACELLLEDEMLLFSVSRDLYPKIAERCGYKGQTIERNIRTVVYRAWENSRERLIEIAGYNMTAPPTVTEFLGILISYLQRQEMVVHK